MAEQRGKRGIGRRKEGQNTLGGEEEDESVSTDSRNLLAPDFATVLHGPAPQGVTAARAVQLAWRSRVACGDQCIVLFVSKLLCPPNSLKAGGKAYVDFLTT